MKNTTNLPTSSPLKINTALAKLVDTGPITYWDHIRTNIFLNPNESEPYKNIQMPAKRCHAASCTIRNMQFYKQTIRIWRNVFT